MQSSQLLEGAESLWLELTSELEDVDPLSNSSSNLENYQYNLMRTDEYIRRLKSLVHFHVFSNMASEIQFFKKIKPKFISEFIFLSKIIELESTIPKAGKENVKEVLEKQLEMLGQFAIENRDFIAYFRKGASYLDDPFFLRSSYDLYVTQSLSLHSHDENFSTSHDGLVALIIANDKYELYLSQRLQGLDDLYMQNIISQKSPLEWSASKAGLVEVLYGLQQMKAFNQGAIEFSKVVKTFETCFNVDLGNYHKTLGEIRDRKTERTKFLNQMSEVLVKAFEETDGK
ncbi:RteC domain-containing protein [Chryseobacterium sp. A301]